MELLLLVMLDGHVAADILLLGVVDDVVDDALMTCSTHSVFLVGLKENGYRDVKYFLDSR